MDFGKLIEDNGLTSMHGRALADTEVGKKRVKLQCRFLIQHIQPEELRVEDPPSRSDAQTCEN